MRFFFKSRQFKIILSVVLILIAVSCICVFAGGRISPQSDVIATVTAPFKAAVTKVSNVVSDFVKIYTDGNKALLQNAELESEINELRKKVADYEQVVHDNEFYKNYLEIKDNHSDFKFEAATVISRDSKDPYKSFIINKGTVDKVKANDPIITEEGLVGFVSEVGMTTSKVSTVLSPDILLGALDNRTNDSGVLSGNLKFAENGNTKFYNLSRSCNIAVGDYVVTSGEGIFPSGLLIGKIKSVGSDKYNTSIYAEVEPFADVENIREVMIITDFEGKGGLNPKKDSENGK